MNYVYILRCSDGTLYTGWTNDLTRRLAAHNSGKGAKYTRGRAPVTLMFSQTFPTQEEAMGYEAAIKKLSTREKESLIASQEEPGGEYLTVYDSDLRPCGNRPRSVVHAQGLRHMVTHLWVLTGERLWLQQRAFDRPLYPGKFDLTATGHIDPGEDPKEAACREAREEAGVIVSPDQLETVGTVEQKYPRPGGFDNEVVHVYLFRSEHDPDFHPGEEVTRISALPLAEYERGEALYAKSEPGTVTFEDGEQAPLEAFCCWHGEEWQLVRKYLQP